MSGIVQRVKFKTCYNRLTLVTPVLRFLIGICESGQQQARRRSSELVYILTALYLTITDNCIQFVDNVSIRDLGVEDGSWQV